MEEVIDMVPGEAISLDHLGDIYYAMNRKREASFFWKQAKDLASPEDDIKSLRQKIQALEHQAYPMVVNWLAQNKLQLINSQAWLNNAPLNQPLLLT